MRPATVAAVLVLAACAGAARAPHPTAAPPAAAAAPSHVGADEARRLVAEGALLVDVRDPADFARDGLPGATSVPLAELEARRAELGPPSLPVVVYCQTGKRSAEAARKLASLGYTRVYDLGPRAAWDEPAPGAATRAGQ